MKIKGISKGQLSLLEFMTKYYLEITLFGDKCCLEAAKDSPYRPYFYRNPSFKTVQKLQSIGYLSTPKDGDKKIVVTKEGKEYLKANKL